MTKKRSLRKRFLLLIDKKHPLKSKLTFIMQLNGIISTIMQHSRSWSAFTLDAFLAVANLIYKNLFNHQPFDDLSIIINTIKVFAKKKEI